MNPPTLAELRDLGAVLHRLLDSDPDGTDGAASAWTVNGDGVLAIDGRALLDRSTEAAIVARYGRGREAPELS